MQHTDDNPGPNSGIHRIKRRGLFSPTGSSSFVAFVAAMVAWMSFCWICPALHADDWPQWRGPNRDGVWRESGIVDRLPASQIPLRWSVPISGGYSGPTVADGRVYVSDRVEQPDEQERIHCFRWTDGQKLWTFAYECRYGALTYRTGPRASVTVADGLAYSLGSVGHLVCLDAETGRMLWRKDLRHEYQAEMPEWGIASAPLVEGDLLICQVGGPGGACLVAFDKRTGQERWRALDDPASYSAPILIEQAGRRVLVCWTGSRVVGVDPQTGELLWDSPFRHSRWIIAIATPVFDRNRLFVSAFYDGSLMLRVDPDRPAVEEIWRRRGVDERQTDALHALMSTPCILGDYVYGVDTYGELRCLDARTGDRIWEDRTATSQVRWGNIHMVQNGEYTWMFNDQGELIIARLTPGGYHELSRAKLIEPTLGQLRRRDGVCWSHPAFAYRHVFARNDVRLVCASLAAE